MKAKLHSKHPVYLKLQDAVKLYDKLTAYNQLAHRGKDGVVTMQYNYRNYLCCLVSDKEYNLNGWRISKYDLLENTHYLASDIVKTVELFDDVDLEAVDINNILRTLESYDRTMYVIEQENINLDK